jgi:hypothetical protein
VGIILEPLEIDSTILDKLHNCSEFLDLILTFDERILNLFANARPYSPGGTMMGISDTLDTADKKRKVSIVASSKNFTEGHKLRHEIIRRFSGDFEIDVFGEGYAPFSDRSKPYRDYEYTIVVENAKYKSHYFTEKFIDPVLLQCIPLYWGASDIGKHFDDKGIRQFNTLLELEQILCQIRENRDFVDAKVLKSNRDIAVNFMSKEWNIQKVLEEHINGIELPDLNRLMVGYSNFLVGKSDFASAEPLEFIESNGRFKSDVGVVIGRNIFFRIKKRIMRHLWS